MYLPLSFSQSVTRELEIVVDPPDGEDKQVETARSGDMVEDGAEVVLDVVDLLLVLVNDLIGVKYHVTSK